MAQTHGSLQKISELFMMTESPGMVISVLITGRLSRLAAVLRDIPCPIIFLIVSGILRYGFPETGMTQFSGLFCHCFQLL